MNKTDGEDKDKNGDGSQAEEAGQGHEDEEDTALEEFERG